MGIALPTGTQCTISPEGVTNDPAHTSGVLAATDGMARFFPPPGDWGTRLALSCTLNGSSQGQFLIDLNDSSTFQKLLVSDLKARRIAVRPALTGDLTAISPDALSTGRYPPRPDPTAAPAHYAKWVQKVTRPMDEYSGVQVSGIDEAFGYAGTGYGYGWNGFVQTAAGFSGSQLFANCCTFYQEYLVEIYAPQFPYPICDNGCLTGVWAGIGGAWTWFFGGLTQGGLIQSGLAFRGTEILSFFYEYYPGWDPQYVMGRSPGNGDQLTVWGWSASDANCTHSTNGQYACFAFEDDTAGWYTQPGSLYINGPRGSGASWFPSTVEYAAEEVSGWSNANYGSATMQYGAAYDFGGTYHNDPSIGNDPYMTVTTNSNSTGLQLSTFGISNNSMWFDYYSSN